MDNIRKRKNNDEIEVMYDEKIKMTQNKKLSLNDKKSICLLIFLYVLQGIPLGLAGSVPLILQSYHVSYKTQATFSFVFWPFSLKILWAPIVDSMFVTRWGRRKTWLIPAQLLIGITMLFVSSNVSSWLGSEIAIWHLTVSFFLLNLLAATQDIAVDGWALTMLSRQSVGWASTCNSVGQTMGYFIAFIVFLALESTEFCNTWLRRVPESTGLVTFSGFLQFWGVVFLVTTVLVMILKSEQQDSTDGDTEFETNHNVSDVNDNDNTTCDDHGDTHDDGHTREVDLTLKETYFTLWRIVKLKPIQLFVVSLFLVKIGFSATDSITGLKLIEKGVSKEKMAFIGSLIVPVQIMLALLVSKYTTGKRPLSIFITIILPRILFGAVFAVFVHFTPSMQSADGSYHYNYYVLLTALYTSHQFVVYPMFVSLMAFYARISDPSVGGTYMTLLNTMSNLSANMPNTLMLYLVDYLTVKRCLGGPFDGMSCSSKPDLNSCTGSQPSGVCNTVVDGYYVEVIICLIFGLVALFMRKKYFVQVQNLPLSAWRVFKSAKSFTNGVC